MGGLLAERVGDRVALATVAVWGAFPAAVSLQIAYTEAIAMLVLCGLLWALHPPATGCSSVRWRLLLGVTRPVAVPVAVVGRAAAPLRWRRRAATRSAPGSTSPVPSPSAHPPWVRSPGR